MSLTVRPIFFPFFPLHLIVIFHRKRCTFTYLETYTTLGLGKILTLTSRMSTIPYSFCDESAHWTMKRVSTLKETVSHPIFFSLLSRLPYMEMSPRLWTCFPALHQQWAPSSKFSSFFYYFDAIFDLAKCTLPPFKMCWRPWKWSPTLSPTVFTIPQFFLICLLFYCYFSFEEVCIAFFRNEPFNLENI